MKNTVAQSYRMGDKCIACGLFAWQAMSLASLDRGHGCQGTKYRRHHFPRRITP